MNDRVKELIAWRDEYNKLYQEANSHHGGYLFEFPRASWTDDDKSVIDEWSAMVRMQDSLRVKIQNRAFEMVDHIEKLEKKVDRKETIISWYIDETGIYYPGYRDE